MADTRSPSLEQFADDKQLQNEWAAAKAANKLRFAGYLESKTGVKVDARTMFDIQIKRIHEYKRQLLNILGVIYRYKKIKVKEGDALWQCLASLIVNYIGK